MTRMTTRTLPSLPRPPGSTQRLARLAAAAAALAPPRSPCPRSARPPAPSPRSHLRRTILPPGGRSRRRREQSAGAGVAGGGGGPAGAGAGRGPAESPAAPQAPAPPRSATAGSVEGRQAGGAGHRLGGEGGRDAVPAARPAQGRHGILPRQPPLDALPAGAQPLRLGEGVVAPRRVPLRLAAPAPPAGTRSAQQQALVGSRLKLSRVFDCFSCPHLSMGLRRSGPLRSGLRRCKPSPHRDRLSPSAPSPGEPPHGHRRRDAFVPAPAHCLRVPPTGRKDSRPRPSAPRPSGPRAVDVCARRIVGRRAGP